MFKITYDIHFTEEKYICIWGQLVKTDDTLFGVATWSFQKVYPGMQTTTCREHLDQFDTYSELVAAFPEQEVPEEEYL